MKDTLKDVDDAVAGKMPSPKVGLAKSTLKSDLQHYRRGHAILHGLAIWLPENFRKA